MFCNTNAGNEKGHVERSIEYIRRKAFAFRDHFESLDEANDYLDLPGDIRDLSYDLSHWKWSLGHLGGTVLDGISLAPLIGFLKYGDEGKELLDGARRFKLKTPAGLKYSSYIGEMGELRSVFAKLDAKYLDTGTDTNKSSRKFARLLGLPTDDAGHGPGNRLGRLGNKSLRTYFTELKR